ncbi:hypothetical protein KEM48_010117 [Puccinia striiformis f. sp. tritici PST-130]|nr:hypothetical protein KEM48_010117 [Puccinia striiformis f. sp. tritici PST-130]
MKNTVRVMDHVLEPEHMDLHRCNFWFRYKAPVAVFSLIKPTRQKEVSDGEFAKSHRNWILFFRHSHKHYKSCYHNVHRWVIIRDLDSRCPQSHLTAMELYIHGMCRYQVEHIAQAGHPKVIGQVELVEVTSKLMRYRHKYNLWPTKSWSTPDFVIASSRLIGFLRENNK